MTRLPSDNEPFSGLAFKVMADQFLGTLTFVRVYRYAATHVGKVTLLHFLGKWPGMPQSCLLPDISSTLASMEWLQSNGTEISGFLQMSALCKVLYQSGEHMC